MAGSAGVKENVKRVFYVRFLNHPIYLDLIAQRPEIRLDKLENDSPDTVTVPVIGAAHAYQVSSARDELPMKYHATRELHARAPNLLIVSTGGAGYDNVNVKDCTDAGVLLVNQTGGNADAVAAHVLAMVLMLSKQIIQTNHTLRKGTMHDRNAFMGNDIHNRTIGIVGISRAMEWVSTGRVFPATEALEAGLVRSLHPKEELLDGVWGDHFVSESALTTHIKHLRRALGDDGRAQRVIRTVPRQGWRFVAPVARDSDRPAPGAAGVERPPRTRYATSGGTSRTRS